MLRNQNKILKSIFISAIALLLFLSCSEKEQEVSFDEFAKQTSDIKEGHHSFASINYLIKHDVWTASQNFKINGSYQMVFENDEWVCSEGFPLGASYYPRLNDTLFSGTSFLYSGSNYISKYYVNPFKIKLIIFSDNENVIKDELTKTYDKNGFLTTFSYECITKNDKRDIVISETYKISYKD